jgi:hypothetical protein
MPADEGQPKNQGQGILDQMERLRRSQASLSVPPSLFERPSLHIPKIATPKEQNAFQSSGVLVRRMAETVAQWRAQVPSDSQPVVLALLQSGVQITQQSEI